VYLDAVRASLDDRSEESFRKALGSEQHLAAIASLHASCNCDALENSLEALQQELHRPGADKPAILRRIAAVLRQKSECGCD
jgi:glycine cleavage system regulatory protein